MRRILSKRVGNKIEDTYLTHDVFAIKNVLLDIVWVADRFLVHLRPQHGLWIDVGFARVIPVRIPRILEAALLLRDQLRLVPPLVGYPFPLRPHLLEAHEVLLVDSAIAGSVREPQLDVIWQRDDVPVDLLLDVGELAEDDLLLLLREGILQHVLLLPLEVGRLDDPLQHLLLLLGQLLDLLLRVLRPGVRDGLGYLVAERLPVPEHVRSDEVHQVVQLVVPVLHQRARHPYHGAPGVVPDVHEPHVPLALAVLELVELVHDHKLPLDGGDLVVVGGPDKQRFADDEYEVQAVLDPIEGVLARGARVDADVEVAPPFELVLDRGRE